MRLIFISLDALARPYFDELTSFKNFKWLKENSAFCKNMQTSFPSITYPIHTSLITGCYPVHHGIEHNMPFDENKKKHLRAWYWDIKNIKVKTLFEAFQEKRKCVASLLYPVSGKAKCIRYNFPEVIPLEGENPVIKMVQYASKVWILWMEMLYGKTRPSIQQPDLDDYATLLTTKLLRKKHPPDALFLHLVDGDSMQHQYGVDSAQLHDALQRLDKRFGCIKDTLEKHNLLKDTVFAVVSDHGQKDVHTGILLDDILKRDLGDRAQSFGMGAYIFPKDLSKTVAYLKQNKEKLHIKEILDQNALKKLHAVDQIQLAVQSEDGYYYMEQDEKTHQADHGFSLSDENAKCLLFLCGAPFKKGCEIEHANVVDVAPTLAKVFDLKLEHTDGHVLQNCLKEENAVSKKGKEHIKIEC